MNSTGRTAAASLRMFPPDTADATLSLPGQHVPARPASSRLAEVMEQAAARLMRSRLQVGESSVAISTNLQHSALSRSRGDTLHARATCERIDGRLHHFLVHVFDASGLVASGEHVRAVVGARAVASPGRRRHARPSLPLRA